MDSNKYYSESIKLLDNFLEETQEVLIPLSPEFKSWKERIIFNLLNQSSTNLYILLSNSDKSQFVKEKFGLDPVFIGAIGRILRDIYVNIIYLKSDIYSADQMQDCWNYQIDFTRKKLTSLLGDTGDNRELEILDEKIQENLNKLNVLTFETKGRVIQGLDEKLLSLNQLANLKNFDKHKFHTEFSYFSQFTHSTAFANNLITEKGIDFNVIADLYGRIVPYYVGIVTECLESFDPDHIQYQDLNNNYEKIISKRWK